MKIQSKIFALVLASVLVCSVAINQVYALRGCSRCIEFKKLTHEFEKNVIQMWNTCDDYYRHNDYKCNKYTKWGDV